MGYVLNVFPSEHRARLLALVILLAALGAAVFGGIRLGGAPPGVEAAPAAAPNAQVGATGVYIQFTVDGTTLEGDSPRTHFGVADWSEVFSFSVSASTPRDLATGLTTGRPQMNPITVTKAIDKSSPLLFQAWMNNQVVDAEIKVIRPDLSPGTEEEVLQYILEGGFITGHRINVISGDNKPETETLALSFQTLGMTWPPNGAMAFYSYVSP